MTRPEDEAPIRREWCLWASLAATFAAGWFLSQVFPVSSHADDWPGPYVGAALCLELAGAIALGAMILAASGYLPPRRAFPAVTALASIALYLAVGVSFAQVGAAPFCGASADALAGNGGAPAAVSAPSLLDPCALFLLAQYLVPLGVMAGVFTWRYRQLHRA